ncbi:MAG: helix-turn-helix domain-containing protein [Candidatus Glassbacteria bacterium]|nr:helix-turn-helix domain-containing protein [Candidatus Glassbacteria bacterium]
MKSTESLDTVGDRIRRVRKDNKLSQKVFGKICGVSQLTLLRYETNYRGPDIKFLLKMSENFNVNVNWVLRKIGEAYFSDTPKETARIFIDIEDLHEAFKAFSSLLQAQGHLKAEGPATNKKKVKVSPDGSVLLVCSDHRILPAVSDPLKVAGYEVVVTENYKEAASLMGSKAFQLLVLDMQLDPAGTMGFMDDLRGRNQSAVLLLAESRQTEKALDILEQLEADYLDRDSLKARELLFKAGRLIKSNGLAAKANGGKN